MNKLIYSLTLLIITLHCQARADELNENPRGNIDADKYQCQKEAVQMYPTIYIQRQPAANQGTQCQAVQNGWLTTMDCKPQMAYGDWREESHQPIDANQENRNRAFASCMQAKGWRLNRR